MFSTTSVEDYSGPAAQTVYRSIKKTLEPWVYQKVEIITRRNLDFFRDELYFALHFAFGREELVFKIERDIVFLLSPNEYYEEIARLFHEAWINRPFPELTDNIILSEN